MVELLGEHYGVDDAATDAGTIGYEILTALGARYHRDLPRSRRDEPSGMTDSLRDDRRGISRLPRRGRAARAALRGQALAAAFSPPYFPRLIVRQVLYIGYFSLPVVGLTALFTGMVLALQIYTGFSRFNAESAIATVVVLVDDPRTGAGHRRPDGGRTGRRRDGGRDRHHARHRADRRADHACRPIRCNYLVRAAADRRAGDACRCWSLVADIIGVFGGYLVGVYKLELQPGHLPAPRPSSTSRRSTSSPAWSRPRCSASSSR